MTVKTKALLIVPLIVLLLAPLVTAAQPVQPMLLSGMGANAPHFVSAAISCSSTCAYTSGASSGATIGTASAALSSGTFTGTWSTSGTAAADFTFSGNALQVNSSTPTCSSTTALNLNIVATQPGVQGSPYPRAITVTCNPSNGTTACDVGPPYTGQVPAAATQAGFTKCAANYDWTYTQNWTNTIGGNTYTYNWSSMSGGGGLSPWFSCNEGDPPPALIYYAAGSEGADVGCDTSHYKIANDSGMQAFATTYYQSDANAGHYSSPVVTQGSSTNAVYNLRDEYYIETVRRQDNTNPYTTQITASDLSTFDKVNGNPCFFATDMEWDSGASGTGVGQSWWNGTCGQSSGFNGTCGVGGNCATPSSGDGAINTSVTTWGNLTTGDGNSHAASCNYWGAGAVQGLTAGAFKSCFSNDITGFFTGGSSTQVFNTGPLYQYLETGPHRNTNITMQVNSFTTYWYRITIWECPGYANGGCITNPVVTGGP